MFHFYFTFKKTKNVISDTRAFKNCRPTRPSIFINFRRRWSKNKCPIFSLNHVLENFENVLRRKVEIPNIEITKIFKGLILFDFKTVKTEYLRRATAPPPTYKHDGVKENRDWLRFGRFVRFEIILDFELRTELFKKRIRIDTKKHPF